MHGVAHEQMRAHNERLILSLVRRRSLSQAELAKMAGLSAQTVSVIMRNLEDQDLIQRGEPLRGRIGQPSVPMSLNPEGAFFMGAKVGRRSSEVVLLDMCGTRRLRNERHYAWPDPEATVGWLVSEIARVREHLRAKAGRLRGLGIAIPFRIWEWSEKGGAPAGAMERWKTLDFKAELCHAELEVSIMNDGSAACAAEYEFGALPTGSDFAYFYVGTFVGGGLVHRGELLGGPTGNAGALGSILVPDGRGRAVQLIDQASLITLEEALDTAGEKPSTMWHDSTIWYERPDLVQPWLDRAARALAHAVVSTVAVSESPLVIIDGSFPPTVHSLLIDKVRRHVSHINVAGIEIPAIRAGTLGSVSRALGAASTILSHHFCVAPVQV